MDRNFNSDEYNALRNDNRNRHDYYSKINTGFVTFTTAVLTISISLFIFIGSTTNLIIELYEKAHDSNLQDELRMLYQNKYTVLNVTGVALQYFQAFLILSPVLYSKICFNHALENSVCMSLNSDYLQRIEKNPDNLSAIKNKYTDSKELPKSDEVFPYYFGSFGALCRTHRVGDLGAMHWIISFLCLLFGGIFGSLVFIHCVYSDAPIIFKPFLKSLGIVFAGGAMSSIVSHFIIILKAKRKMKKAKASKTVFDGRPYKKKNMIFMFALISIVFLVSVLLFCLTIATKSFEFFSELTGETLISLCFALLFMFCIFQFPGYYLELDAASNKIEHNSNALELHLSSEKSKTIDNNFESKEAQTDPQ